VTGRCRRGRVRHPAVDVDSAEPPPRDRLGHLPAQRLVAEPVAKLQGHQLQVGLDGHARPAQPGVEVCPERLQRRLVIQPGIHPLQPGRQPHAHLRQHRLPTATVAGSACAAWRTIPYTTAISDMIPREHGHPRSTLTIVDLLLQVEVARAGHCQTRCGMHVGGCGIDAGAAGLDRPRRCV
jgi:hypothetical protein